MSSNDNEQYKKVQVQDASKIPEGCTTMCLKCFKMNSDVIITHLATAVELTLKWIVNHVIKFDKKRTPKPARYSSVDKMKSQPNELYDPNNDQDKKIQ